MEIPGVKQAIGRCHERLNEITSPGPTCPFCGSRDWARLAGGRVTELRNVSEELYPSGRPLKTTALGFLCAGCGFVRLHYVDPSQWGMPGQGRL